MNTTTNTRVSEAMVERFKAAFAEHSTISPGYDGCISAALEAALSARQGQGEVFPTACMPPEQEEMKAASMAIGSWLAAALDDPSVCDEMKRDINRWFDAAMPSAPPAQPAERVPEGWRVLQIGAVGSAYDPPNTRRAFTYDWQPGNGAAWALGKASSSAAKASAGDYIDGGLNLLKALQEQGFGVFQIEPSATPAAPAEEGDGKEGVR